ncbi:MAG: aldolase [Cellvibrionales bacterium]|nr:aldolase [Cellvibrionales bacterium]
MQTSKDTPRCQFRQTLLNRELLVGTFQKTPSAMVSEVLGLTELDVVCLDAEHAPFGRAELDACLLALRAAGMPSLVRVSSASAEQIVNALDCGASGVMVPHLCSVAVAEKISRAAQFGRGGRGYAGSTRAAGYGTKKMLDHQEDSAATTTVIAQIEDPEALESIDEIAKVEGIHCLFAGRVDLAVALGAETLNDAAVIEAVETVCAAGRKQSRPVGMFLADRAEIPRWQARGASFFLVASDHSFMLSGAAELHRSARS